MIILLFINFNISLDYNQCLNLDLVKKKSFFSFMIYPWKLEIKGGNDNIHETGFRSDVVFAMINFPLFAGYPCESRLIMS